MLPVLMTPGAAWPMAFITAVSVWSVEGSNAAVLVLVGTSSKAGSRGAALCCAAGDTQKTVGANVRFCSQRN